jgi:dsRNA-specific ribonuclease
MLLEIAQAVGSQPAVFDVVEVSPQRFRSECRFVIGGVKGMARGEGTSKAAAKTEAAREALAWLTATGVVEGAPISPAPPPG